MKKYLKVMVVLVIALSLLSTVVFASGFTDAMSNAQNAAGDTLVVTGHINRAGGVVITAVQTLGYIIAVVMVLYVGIQYLIGTPAKKQELKGRMVSLIIGAILVAGGVTLLGWVADFATKDLGMTEGQQAGQTSGTTNVTTEQAGSGN